MRYEDWNEVLAQNFFHPKMAGRRVYLYTTVGLLNRLGEPHEVDVDDFLAAIKQRHRWSIQANHFCDGVVACMETWHQQHRRLPESNFDKHYPPYLAYLAFFALAAGRDAEGFSRHAYHAPLNELLGREIGAGTLPGFAKVDRVWEDLERWANDEQDGRLGYFFAEAIGHAHVGYPMAQMLLSEEEREHLPGVFARAGLSPTFPPSDGEVAALVARHGRQNLRPRTLRLLGERNGENPRAHEVLLEILTDELAQWDGQMEERESQTNGASSRRCSSGSLWLTLEDQGFRDLHAGLRAHVAEEFPEDELTLRSRNNDQVYSCIERAGGWSWPLAAPDNSPLDATCFDWTQDIELSDPDLGWTFRMTGSPVRLFEKGHTLGVQGWAETRRLRREVPFRLAVAPEARARIETWGAEDCQGFAPIPDASGLPDEWGLYRAEAALRDQRVRDAFPVLTFPSRLRLRFGGGVRFGRGDEFFAFAPPEVVVEGAPEHAQLYCKGQPMETAGEGRYTLPLDEHRFRIEVRQGDEVLLSRTVFLRQHLDWTRRAEETEFDQFGQPFGAPEEEPVTVAGARVRGEVTIQDRLRTFLPVRNTRKVFLIGRMPGQIVKWPQEPLPEWEPIWEVPMEKRGQAFFHGESLDVQPAAVPERVDQKHLRLWKDVLWHKRKRIKEPLLPCVRVLWFAYREAAHAAK